MATYPSSIKLVLLISLVNLVLYVFLIRFNSLIHFSHKYYTKDSHHFLPDPKAIGQPFSLVSALAQFDSQWYIKIAGAGYPNSHIVPSLNNRHMDTLTYAFFPLYPLFISPIYLITNHILLSAFIITNLLFVLNIFSLYHLVSRLFSQTLALKTTLLFFIFPSSIFFRGYFSESLQLLLIIWFLYFFTVRKFFMSAVFLSLLNITKTNLFLLNPLFLLIHLISTPFSLRHLLRTFVLFIILLLPFSVWLIYSYHQTGNPLAFLTAFRAWYPPSSASVHFYHNLLLVGKVLDLPWHNIHFSRVDVLVSIIIPLLLYRSRSFLPRQLWLFSFILWVTPLFTKDLASFVRYQSISFPLFIYLAHSLKNLKAFAAVLILSTLALFLIGLHFVNWYWLG